VSWAALVWRNLLRRPARTALTAAGVSLGVALIVACSRSRRACTGRRGSDPHRPLRLRLFQGEVSDLSRSLLPESIAASIARQPGVADVAKVKLLVDRGQLVFGLDRDEFAYRRLVVLARHARGRARRRPLGKDVGDAVESAAGPSRSSGVYHSGDRFEDLGFVVPLHDLEAIAKRPARSRRSASS
jgi:hypothetical protein